LEKAIEIKRRAQRCILNGDLDGALREYEKLVAVGDSDPYHLVLLADLLFKKGDHAGASRRYLEAVDGYERAGLAKNAIAVCKKMSRLWLSPPSVLLRLAGLHALDGLATESSLYYMQHAELVLRSDEYDTAVESLRLAFQVCPDNVKALERLAEIQERAGAREDAAETLIEAAREYERLGQVLDARRCQSGADQLDPGISSRPRNGAAERVPETGAPPTNAAPAWSPADVGVASLDRGHASVARETGPTAAAPLEITTSALSDPVAREASAPVELKSSQGRPGLGFDGSSAETVTEPVEEDGTGGEEDAGLPEVSRIIREAQTLFETGQHEAASAALVRAAQTYDRIGRFENAAAIYRNLGKVTEAPLQVMMLWLKNCRRRDDRAEAARVACELGDRALKKGDAAGAREWFERARSFDDGNEHAQRRLQRLVEQPGQGAVATVPHEAAPQPEPASGAPAAAADRPMRARREGVEVKGVHDESAVFDLGALIGEFQRNLELQLSADSQSHYDLAMSYREMGLFNEAIRSFELAGNDAAFRVRSSEMIGRSLLEQGDFDGAVATFRSTLELSELDPDAVIDVHFQLGLALEAAGRADEALAEFETIYGAAPNYPHVASKISALRKATGRP